MLKLTLLRTVMPNLGQVRPLAPSSRQPTLARASLRARAHTQATTVPLCLCVHTFSTAHFPWSQLVTGAQSVTSPCAHTFESYSNVFVLHCASGVFICCIHYHTCYFLFHFYFPTVLFFLPLFVMQQVS